jgi:hypothetical protein
MWSRPTLRNVFSRGTWLHGLENAMKGLNKGVFNPKSQPGTYQIRSSWPRNTHLRSVSRIWISERGTVCRKYTSRGPSRLCTVQIVQEYCNTCIGLRGESSQPPDPKNNPRFSLHVCRLRNVVLAEIVLKKRCFFTSDCAVPWRNVSRVAVWEQLCLNPWLARTPQKVADHKRSWKMWLRTINSPLWNFWINIKHFKPQNNNKTVSFYIHYYSKSSVFWDITPCSPLNVNGCFRGIYRLNLWGRRIRQTRKAGWRSTGYTALYPRRLYSS